MDQLLIFDAEEVGVLDDKVRWATILEVLYTHKIRIIDMHPDAVLGPGRMGTIEFDLKATGQGHGKVVAEMVAPWTQNDPDGIKFDVVPWNDGMVTFRLLYDASSSLRRPFS